MYNELKKKIILGVGVTDELESTVLEYVLNSLRNNTDKYYIVTPNPEILVYAQKDHSFKRVLNEARIALPDGIGLLFAGGVLRTPLQARITGVDFMEMLCKESVNLGKKKVKKRVSIGLLGARKGIAVRTAECLMKKYPGLQIVYASDTWSEAGFRWRNSDTVSPIAGSSESRHEKIASSIPPATYPQIDILFVAFGFPKQEFWMKENIERLPVQIMLGVGGAFDYLSGSLPRAPRILRNLGLEWLYRLFRQPWRIKRQLALPFFLFLVLHERFIHTQTTS